MFEKKQTVTETEPQPYEDDFEIFGGTEEMLQKDEKETKREEEPEKEPDKEPNKEPDKEHDKEPEEEKTEEPTEEKETTVEWNEEKEKKYKEWEEISGLWEMAKNNPTEFLLNMIGNVQSSLPPKEQMIAEIMKKYGEDFEYDPVEAYKNPNSDHAKYKRDIDKIELMYQMEEIEMEKSRQQMVAETERVYRDGQKKFRQLIEDIKKEYNVTDKEIASIVAELGEPNKNATFPEKLNAYMDLLCKYITASVKATKGLQKLKQTIEVEKRVDAVAKKKIPSSPASGKSVSPPDDELNIEQILLGD